MKPVKQTAEYTIFQRKDKRYAVQGANKKWINGDDKVAILRKEDLMKKPEPKAAAPAEEAAEEQATEGNAE